MGLGWDLIMEKRKEASFLLDMLVGSVSAGISKTIIAPIERVKLLLQLQDASSQLTAKTRYTGISNCIMRVFREQGFLSFWRGNMANIYRYFPATAFSFATKDWFKRTFYSVDPTKDFRKFFIGNIVAGGFAGASTTFVVYPLDFARTRLAADVGREKKDRLFTGLTDCIVKVVRAEGITGVYRGMMIAIPGFMIYRALYFGLYDTWMSYRMNESSVKPSAFTMYLAANSITALSGLLLYPFDTIRRRLMMQSGRTDVLYSGVVDCMRKIYRTEGGLKAFYKGGLTNLLRSIGGAIVLVLYDEFKGQMA